jgi:hypothetical protein
MSRANACLVPVRGYACKMACYVHHTTTDQSQLDIMHAHHWRRQEALYEYLGPMQELLLRRIVAMPGCSQRAATAPFCYDRNARRSVRRLREMGLITIGQGRGRYVLNGTAKGLWWADYPRNDPRSGWTAELFNGIAMRRYHYVRPQRVRAHSQMVPAYSSRKLDRLIGLAETTKDFELRERLIDEVGVLVAEQIARVTGRDD